MPSTWERPWVHSTAERLFGSPSTQYCPVVWTWISSLELSACNSACVEACVPTNLLASLPRFNLGPLAGTGAGAVISALTSLLLEWCLVSSVALYPCSEIRVGCSACKYSKAGRETYQTSPWPGRHYTCQLWLSSFLWAKVYFRTFLE